MLIESGASRYDIAQQKKINQTQFFKSRFQFLNEVAGLRPACLMGLLGTSGAGKSTLFKAIIADSSHEKKVLVILTEEEIAEYQIGLEQAGANMENVRFLREKMITSQDVQEMKMMLKETIFASKCDAVFYDNLTTSAIYEPMSVRQQQEFVRYLAEIATETNCCIFFVAHTRKDVTDNQGRLIEGEDIRGSNQPFQQSQYFFILQTIQSNSNLFPFIRIRKHRFHDVKNKFFLLKYNGGQYKSDVQVDFSKVSELFAIRNKIKG